MSGFDSFSNITQGSDSTGDSAPLSSTQPPSAESNRDSLNLDDFEKVDTDQLLGAPTSSPSLGFESVQATAESLVGDIMAKANNAGDDLFGSFGKDPSPQPETKKDEDLFKIDKDFDSLLSSAPPEVTSSTDDKQKDLGFEGLGLQDTSKSNFTDDLLSSVPPMKDEKSPVDTEKKSTDNISAFEDFLSKHDDVTMQNFSIPDVKDEIEPMFDNFSKPSPLEAPVVPDPSPVEPVKETSADLGRNPTPPRTPTAPDLGFDQPKRQPSPPRTPTPPPREESPPPRQPTPPLRQPTPPRTPTPPPRESTPPREPTPPRVVKPPTPPREPTPPPREPTPPPKEPTPPPKEPTPPPKEPTPPPKEPTPPPKEPTPPRKVTPPPAPRTPTPPPVSAPVQEPKISSSPVKKSYTASASTQKAFNVFKPRAWFNPDQLDPRVVDLIYWRNVKKTGIVFGTLMVILLSLAYLSLISVVAYTSLALLTGTITFRVYKNIMQAVQKSQDGHPFKCVLDMDTDLPSDKVHEATDIIVSQINATISELKRLFLVEDLVDSVKFGCLLWCLTYLGAWFNGLTLVILAVVAIFSLPKVYEQNQAQIDQYLGLVRSQVNDVMSKVKAALPIGNKEKSQ